MLFNQIKADRDAARKEGDTFVVTALGTLLGEIQLQWSKLKVDQRGEVPDDALVGKIVLNFVGNLEELKKSKHTVAMDKELELYSKYQPKLLNATELEALVLEHLESYSESKGNKVKYVMEYLKTEYPNRYDSKQAISFIPR